ncbi:MAG: alanine--tRNA ligase-related protein, partial [Patescibacteria group bacterium]
MISYHDFRQKFLDFFQSNGHKIISSASLIPENDPTVLFTTAGMHPLVPYLLGEKHPEGARLTNAQKCLRTDDIDEVGDRWHLTFFEMLGNWSLGYQGGEVKDNDPYWKKESIEWSWEFLTDKKWLGLDPQKIFVSVFAGDEIAPRDDEAAKIWQEVFARAGVEAKVGEGERIGLYGRAKNWWGPAGQTGPCGPDTEIFYDTGKEHDSKFGDKCHQNCDCGRFAEIWNNVFMQYAKTFDGDCIEMTFKNVDTGMGLERVLAIINSKSSVFETEGFLPIIRKIEELSGKNYATDFETTKAMRIIADHLRAAVFILGDERGVVPSNIEQGYILRRLIRRAIRFGYQLGVKKDFTPEIARLVMQIFGKFYPELEKNQDRIWHELSAEEKKF